jgi:hypothetical protein
MNLWTQLREHNASNKALFTDHKAPKVRKLQSLCCDLARSLSAAQIEQYQQEKDLDKLILDLRESLIPKLLPLFQLQMAWYCPPLDLREISAYEGIILELFVLAIRYDETDNRYPWICTSLPAVSQISYQIMLELLRVTDEVKDARRRNKAQDIERAYWKQRSENLSVDVALEHKQEIAPALKARVLRNALAKYNEVGHLIVHNLGSGVRHPVIEYDVFTFHHRDLATAERFFVNNRSFCVAEVMAILCQCLTCKYDEHAPVEGEFDDKWHVRRANDVGFALRNMAKICEQLDNGMTAAPVWEK